MTPRERVLKTLNFETPDRVPCDLMEGCFWPELLDYFREKHGLTDEEQISKFLSLDFHWVGLSYNGPEEPSKNEAGDPDRESHMVTRGPLADARTMADVENNYDWADPAWWQPGDYEAARNRWPDHALAFSPGWRPLFWDACEAFGMEVGLVKMATEPHLFDAWVRKRHEIYMDFLTRGLDAAKGHCDICWLGDDFAGQQSMMISPELWRKHIKPYLAEQVRTAREHGLYVLYHSCGAVRPVLEDFIEIGINALLVFQTTARGMDAQSIAREFGGRLAFYGGIDVQQLLSFGTLEEVKAEVQKNVRAFSVCGGYIVANSHHRIRTIKGENLEAMCQAARNCTFPG